MQGASQDSKTCGTGWPLSRNRKVRQAQRNPRGGGGTGTRSLISATRVGLSGFRELWTPLFPAKTRKMLRYSSNSSLSSIAGVVSSWVYSANGLFDPDISGTGHQPMGFDQMMLSYEHYTVIRAKAYITFKNTSTGTPVVAITVAPSPTPITVIDQIIEFGGLTQCNLEVKGQYGANKTLTAGCDISLLNGASKILDFNVLRGDVANNPAEQTYFVVQMWSADGTTVTCNFDVVLEFESWFTEPRQLTESLHKMISKALVMDTKALGR